MFRSLLVFWRRVAPAMLLALLSVGCQGDAVADLKDAAVSSGDVPNDWVAADFDQSAASELWEVLPELLQANSDARLLLHVVEGAAGRHGASTIFVEAEEADALPRTEAGDEVFGPLARLLTLQDAILTPDVVGVDPSTYFAVSDVPLAGSLRTRLVRLLDDGYLYSDSAIFWVGPVLAVVTIWYPEQEGPFSPIDELAGKVAQRLQEYVGES